ncbi:DNA-binding transcriptional regulator, LysR family [Cupriavidus sp. YR651]|uniref:LysR substrate-binding domain-containing protein n=1 Tax=Cupriavidus sp. YR651 TaxID=1855315 RepID=UPI00088A1701|nr:LysR substrate-binding domain-containing protein [Cupriavidus sp. YR651]SDD01751.1 DNA-binding transcriptional regulator, LysR family [Cupriavidus sp. YR651]
MKTTLDELLTFTVVVDSGSITAASEQLGQTVSAVSRALGRLEEKLATTLLRRTTRRLELTEEGAAFLTHARHILEAVDTAEEQMAIRRLKPAGKLRVNAATPFMHHGILPKIGEFLKRYPEIELELNTSDQIIDLLEHRTDVAIRIGTLRDSTLHARLLCTSQLRLLASPAYVKAHGTPKDPASLVNHRLLGFTHPESLNQWPVRDEHGDLLQIEPSIRASSGETLRLLALAGEGIACLADFMTDADRAKGDLVELLPSHTIEIRQPIHAVYYRNTQLSHRIAFFINYLSETLANK